MKTVTVAVTALVLSAGAAFAACEGMTKHEPPQTTAKAPVVPTAPGTTAPTGS
jgi:hypothetical protein